MAHAPPPPAATMGYYPAVPTAQRSQLSPRNVKLQRMEATPVYTLAMPLRDQVAVSFRHELLQFHQLLRDAVEASNLQQQPSGGRRSMLLDRDRSLLDLLTSDRGDAVLKEFFTQWRRLQTSQAAESGDLLPPD
ncbi:hypothetical protein BBJ28_00018007, partial [Nothophytophthora sp. Chile5]